MFDSEIFKFVILVNALLRLLDILGISPKWLRVLVSGLVLCDNSGIIRLIFTGCRLQKEWWLLEKKSPILNCGESRDHKFEFKFICYTAWLNIWKVNTENFTGLPFRMTIRNSLYLISNADDATKTLHIPSSRS